MLSVGLQKRQSDRKWAVSACAKQKEAEQDLCCFTAKFRNKHCKRLHQSRCFT